MRFLLRALAGLVILITILMGVGMLLPRDITVERSIEIDAPASEIYPHVVNLEATKAWSPWLPLDPDVELTFNDVPEGVGAVMEWTSDHPQVGVGRMEITSAEADRTIGIALDFGEMGTATAGWDFAEVSGRTTATWSIDMDMGAGPFGRWIGLKMDDWVGADYERGLQNLKELVESER